MLEYIIRKKVQSKAEQSGKKTLMCAGVILAGVGIYFSCKAMKKRRNNNGAEEEAKYLEDSEHDIYDFEEEENILPQEDSKENNNSELEEKIEEFNSRRINCENSPHVSPEEMRHHLNNMEDNKKQTDIDGDNYKEDKYDEYDSCEDK